MLQYNSLYRCVQLCKWIAIHYYILHKQKKIQAKNYFYNENTVILEADAKGIGVELFQNLCW